MVNLRHLDAHNVRLQGELPAADLDIETRDEVMRVTQPLQHDLEVQKLGQSLLVQGRLHLVLDCRCVRCLKPFRQHLELKEWTCHLALQGEEGVPVVNDCVDLTPQVREDILLEFPAHPVCEPECGGLQSASGGKAKRTGQPSGAEPGSPAWVELNKLKF